MRAAPLLAFLLGGCLPEGATDPAPSSPRADAAAPDAASLDLGLADASPDAAGDAGFAPVVELRCPGDPGCAAEPGGLRVGAAALPVSDVGFERPRLAYLDDEDCTELQARCGALTELALKNCGADGLCPEDEVYPGPDADGSEGDLAEDGGPAYDYFHDCGLDALCPGDEGYPGPDEGEGDGRFQGLWIAGFGTNRPAVGVRDHAWARTVAIEQGGTLVTLTVVDAVGLFYSDIQPIRAQARALLAAEAPEVDVDFILVSSTHSHEVPDTMGQWGGEFSGGVPSKTGVVPRYLERLQAQAARSVADAVLALRPARLEVAQTKTGVEGLIRDSRPPIVIDDTLGVARFVDGAGQTVATLVNWGNHPESLQSDNNLISSDFAGALREGLEAGVPAAGDRPAIPGLGGIGLYVQGMVGGLMTPLGVSVRGPDGEVLPEPSFARNDAIGHRLAAMAIDALGDAEVIEEPPLALAAATFRVPAENQVLRLAYLIGLIDRPVYDYDERAPISALNLPSVETQAAVVTLGPLTLYSVPGELFPELAVGGYDGSLSHGLPVVPDDPNAPDLAMAPQPPYLHDLMPGRYRWVIGLGLDELGYMVPPYDFALDPALPYLREAQGAHYEETNSIGPEIVPRTEAVLRALAAALSP